MGLWQRIEQALFTGQVLRDYGPVAAGPYGPGTRTISALLARKERGERFVIKASYKALLAASVQYVELDRDGALRLKAALDDALAQMR